DPDRAGDPRAGLRPAERLLRPVPGDPAVHGGRGRGRGRLGDVRGRRGLPGAGGHRGRDQAAPPDVPQHPAVGDLRGQPAAGGRAARGRLHRHPEVPPRAGQGRGGRPGDRPAAGDRAALRDLLPGRDGLRAGRQPGPHRAGPGRSALAPGRAGPDHRVHGGAAVAGRRRAAPGGHAGAALPQPGLRGPRTQPRHPAVHRRPRGDGGEAALLPQPDPGPEGTGVDLATQHRLIDRLL
ncbi:MAG: hypothetical protein AVDCRST_MAG41-1293, partial [uncultured Corynebacteriales bacterium]